MWWVEGVSLMSWRVSCVTHLQKPGGYKENTRSSQRVKMTASAPEGTPRCGVPWQWLRTSAYFQIDTAWPLDISSSNPSVAVCEWMNWTWLKVWKYLGQALSTNSGHIGGKWYCISFKWSCLLLFEITTVSSIISGAQLGMLGVAVLWWYYLWAGVKCALAMKSDLMVQWKTERKLWNCYVIIYEDCVVCITLVAWQLPMSLWLVRW